MRIAWTLVAVPVALGLAPAAPASPSAVEVAREHVGDVGPVEVVGDAALPGTDAHIVRLRRTFGGLPATAGGSLVVAVDEGRVVFASADAAPRETSLQGDERLLADDAWRRAAAAVGRDVRADAIRHRGHANGFATLGVRSFDVAQQVRR